MTVKPADNTSEQAPGPRTVAIVPSAGMGRRMNAPEGVRKACMEILGRPMLAHTLAAFEATPLIDAVVVVAPSDLVSFCREEIVERFGFAKVTDVVPGGAERQDSVARGIEAAGPEWEITAVHDGARPLVTPMVIADTVAAAAKHGGAVAAVPVKDTIKEGAPAGPGAPVVKRTIPRENLWSVQTPQAFHTGLLLEAHRQARRDGFLGTDESSLVERTGAEVRLVLGSYENIKITTPEDIPVAELILRGRG